MLNYFLSCDYLTGLKLFQAISKRLSRACAKNSVFSQTPTSYVGWTSSSLRSMNISCSESINMNRARRSLTSRTSATFEKSFATCLFDSFIGAAILIITPRFFAFSIDGNRTSSFRLRPSAVVTSVIVFCASRTSMSRWL